MSGGTGNEGSGSTGHGGKGRTGNGSPWEHWGRGVGSTRHRGPGRNLNAGSWQHREWGRWEDLFAEEQEHRARGYREHDGHGGSGNGGAGNSLSYRDARRNRAWGIQENRAWGRPEQRTKRELSIPSNVAGHPVGNRPRLGHRARLGIGWESGVDTWNKVCPTSQGTEHSFPSATTLPKPCSSLPASSKPCSPRDPTSAKTDAQRSLCGVGAGTDPSPPGYRGFGVPRSAVCWGVSPSPAPVTPPCFISMPWAASSS